MKIEYPQADNSLMDSFFNESEKTISNNIASIEDKTGYISDIEKDLGLSGGILITDEKQSRGIFSHVSHGSHGSHASHASHGSHSSW